MRYDYDDDEVVVSHKKCWPIPKCQLSLIIIQRKMTTTTTTKKHYYEKFQCDCITSCFCEL